MTLPSDERLGRLWAKRYRLDAVVGVGSVGTVFRAWHIGLGKTVAVKVIHPELSSDRTSRKRFEREARAASHLSHPHCMEVLDFGECEDESLFMVMEFVDGIDLATMLETNELLDYPRILHIVRQVVHALDRAHKTGIVHRDLKPENVMVTQVHRVHPDMVKVLDFGIAKLLDGSSVATDSFRTFTGMVPGTPHYMSPEQARGEEVDGRSDLYSLGVMLYELVTGDVPFDAKSPLKVISMHLQQEPKRPLRRGRAIPADLETLIMNLIRKDRDERPNSTMEVLEHLNRMDTKGWEDFDEETLASSIPEATDTPTRFASTLLPRGGVGSWMVPIGLVGGLVAIVVFLIMAFR